MDQHRTDPSAALVTGESNPSAPARDTAQASGMQNEDFGRPELVAITSTEISSISVPATLPPQLPEASGLVGSGPQSAASLTVQTHQRSQSAGESSLWERRPLIGGLSASEPWESTSTGNLPSPSANARASRLFRERRKERERVLRETVAELADRNAALEALLLFHGIVPPGHATLRHDLSIHRSQRMGGPPIHIPGVLTSLPAVQQSLPFTQHFGRASSAPVSARDHDSSSTCSTDSSDHFRRVAPNLRTTHQSPSEPVLQATGMVMPDSTEVSTSGILAITRWLRSTSKRNADTSPRPKTAGMQQMILRGQSHPHGMRYPRASNEQPQQLPINLESPDSSDLANLAALNRASEAGTSAATSNSTVAEAVSTAAVAEAASAGAPVTQWQRRQAASDAFNPPTRRPRARNHLRARSPSDSILPDAQATSALAVPERMPTGLAGPFSHYFPLGPGPHGAVAASSGASAALPSVSSDESMLPETWLPHSSTELASRITRPLPSGAARAAAQSSSSLAEPFPLQNRLALPTAPVNAVQSMPLSGRLSVSAAGNHGWSPASAGHGFAGALPPAIGSTGAFQYASFGQQRPITQALALMPSSGSSGQGSGSSASRGSTQNGSYMSAGNSIAEEAEGERGWAPAPANTLDSFTPPTQAGQPGSTLSSPSRQADLAEPSRGSAFLQRGRQERR